MHNDHCISPLRVSCLTSEVLQRAGALCTGVRGDAGVQDNAADWCEGVVEEDVTNNVTGDNHCAEG